MKLRSGIHRRFTDPDGNAFVYVAASAAIVAVDPVSDELVQAFAGDGRDSSEVLRQRSDGAAAASALKDLIDMGVIRPADDPTPPRAPMPPMPFPLATLVLNVTNKCNLSCTYCYEYGADRLSAPAPGAKSPRPMMLEDTARQSIDFLFRSCGERPVVTITFFGGETLLNFGTIMAAVDYAEAEAAKRQKRVHFALTTNATLLTDEVIRFLVAHRFGVTISIDGDQQDQDRHRRYASGKGSFDVIVPRIRTLIATNRQNRGRPVGARVTLTQEASSVLETYRFLTAELGFDEVGFAPVTAAPERAYSLGHKAYDRMLAEFAVLTDDFVAAALSGRPHGFANLNDLLRELHQGIQKAHPCGAGLGLLGVSTEGDLGLCHRFVESKSHEVGNVRTGIDEAVRQDFLQRGHVDTKTDCTQCFARPLCAGGCYHEAHVRFGEATRANVHACEWIRGWTDLGLSAYARIAASKPDFFARYETS